MQNRVVESHNHVQSPPARALYTEEVTRDLTSIELSMLRPSMNMEYLDGKGRTQLVGKISRDRLKKAPFSKWFIPNYESYNMNDALVKKIKKNMKDVSVEVFSATWCGDTRRELPRFTKIMDEIGKPLNVVAVNHEKKTPLGLERGKNIQRVPTFIFYKNGKEIGRIIESPKSSLERDMLRIVE